MRADDGGAVRARANIELAKMLRSRPDLSIRYFVLRYRLSLPSGLKTRRYRTVSAAPLRRQSAGVL
jgi:hypothetical protein